MKQFNLDEYLANPSMKVVTRDGRNVRIICTDFNNPIYPVIGEIKGATLPMSFTASGRHYTGAESPIDLCFSPKKHEGWTPVYRESTGTIKFGYAYSTKKEAEEASKYDTRYITTTKVEWEE